MNMFFKKLFKKNVVILVITTSNNCGESVDTEGYENDEEKEKIQEKFGKIITDIYKQLESDSQYIYIPNNFVIKKENFISANVYD